MEKPQPILAHMPRHIKEKIVNLLDTAHRLPLRQCSKEFKFLVDQWKIVCERLSLEFNQKENVVKMERVIDSTITNRGVFHRRSIIDDYPVKVEFHPLSNGFLKKNKTENYEVFVENGDFIEAAVEQFVKIFRNPKVFIQQLSIFLSDGNGRDELYNQRRELIMDKLNESLGALGRQVAVGALIIDTDDDAKTIRRVLPHLQPGTLKTLNICTQSFRLTPDPHFVDLTRIIEMEQWKQATDLDLTFFDLNLDREATDHFTKMAYDIEYFDIEDLERMIPNFLKKNGWISRRIFGDFDYAAIKQYLSQISQVEMNASEKRTIFTISRNGFECTVDVDEDYGRVWIQTES